MKRARPLSPHLLIYKPQLTSLLSVTHRGTGLFLTLGIPVLAIWLLSLAFYSDGYYWMDLLLSSFIGRLALFGWTFSLFYHLCNGIRHLGWDAGWGMDMPTLYKTGWAVVVISLVLTVAAWSLGYAVRGGSGV